MNSPLWPISQQVGVRGLTALKFFIAARVLAPSAFGQAAVALLALTVLEALSDTGLGQALVQRREENDAKTLGAVATLQFVRGLVVAGALLCVAGASFYFEAGVSSPELLLLAAIIPVARNSVHVSYPLMQRMHKFRRLAGFEVSCLGLDLAVTTVVLVLAPSPAAVLLGVIAAEGARAGFSWLFPYQSVVLNLRWSSVIELSRFGRWIWVSSCFAMLVNQLDKFIVTSLFGATGLGIYQVSARIAQIALADLPLAYASYLFPMFAASSRKDEKAALRDLKRVLVWLVPVLLAGAFVLWISADALVAAVLSDQWRDVVPLLKVMCATMCFGALSAILSSFARGTGAPHLLSAVISVQLVVLILAFLLIEPQSGLIAVAYASLLALGASSALFLFMCFRRQ